MDGVKEKLEKAIWSSDDYYQMAKEGSVDVKHPGMQILLYIASHSRKILDLGCGEGTRLNILANDKIATGIDISDTGIRLGKKKYPKIRFIKADLENIPLNEGFDLVYSAYVLEHLTNPEAVLTEAIRLTSNQGMLVLIAPNYGAPNRCSPVFKGSRISKFIKGAIDDLLNFNNSEKLNWAKVIPVTNKNSYHSDLDTTVEPYIRSLISFLKQRKMTIKTYTSCWDQELPNSKFHQQIFRFFGQLGIFPFNLWGPHLVVVAQK